MPAINPLHHRWALLDSATPDFAPVTKAPVNPASMISNDPMVIIPKDANAVFGGNATQSLNKAAHILLAAYVLIREEYPLLEGKDINKGGKYKVFPIREDYFKATMNKLVNEIEGKTQADGERATMIDTQAALLAALHLADVPSLQAACAHKAQNSPSIAFFLIDDPDQSRPSFTSKCIIPNCATFVHDIFSTDSTVGIELGYMISEGAFHVEGLCNAHRVDAGVNDDIAWYDQWLEIDAQGIQQESIVLNWKKHVDPLYGELIVEARRAYIGGLRRKLRDAARYYQMSVKKYNKDLRKQEQTRLLALESEHKYSVDSDDEELEKIPLGNSRRQNSSHFGNVFDPIQGEHTQISITRDGLPAERQIMMPCATEEKLDFEHGDFEYRFAKGSIIDVLHWD